MVYSQGGFSMDVIKNRYTITELSRELNVTDHTLRYYEREFNIPIPKDSRGRRYYTGELANIMYQIRNMRNEGLEIKAIKKIMVTQGIVPESFSSSLENENNLLPAIKPGDNSMEIARFFEDFKEQITLNVSTEVINATRHITSEISKSKLELGACVENSMRRLESKMERHFQDVDRAIGLWRQKTKGGPLRRFFSRYVR